MKESNIKSMNNVDLGKYKESKYSEYQNYLENVLSKQLLFMQITQFMKFEDLKPLSLCSKKINQIYCNQIKILKIEDNIKASNIKLDKYKNLIEIDLSETKYIKDYSFILNLEKLENLNNLNTNISEISLLAQNNFIK